MCRICREVKKLEPEEALKRVADAMERTPHQMDHLSDLIDRILDSQLGQRDAATEQDWEKTRD